MRISRRNFILRSAAFTGVVAVPSIVSAAVPFASHKSKSNFILWQLPSQTDTIGNSYVFLMNNGKIVVMDGGFSSDAPYLRGFLAALGNEVALWFISHPHSDHRGALYEILKNPGDIRIKKVCHSELSPEYCKTEKAPSVPAQTFYNLLKKSGIPIVNLKEPGKVFCIDKTNFKILIVKNEDFKVNTFNNSSMVIRVWDRSKSFVFLADCGKEEGNRLLNGPFRKDLDCDYLQLAHHGQQGVSMDFYRTIKFKACLWPTPTWLYDNNCGHGYNTGPYKTVETEKVIASLGITENYISYKGLCKIE